jgi:hypothetical protein
MIKSILILALLVPAWLSAQNYSIDGSKIAGGGSVSTGGVYSVSGTIGQPDAGAMAGGNYSLVGGFWSMAIAVQTAGAPKLSITRAGLNAIVSWPDDGSGFHLEQTATVAVPASWAPTSQITSTYATNAGVISVTQPASAGYQFFRLKGP